MMKQVAEACKKLSESETISEEEFLAFIQTLKKDEFVFFLNQYDWYRLNKKTA